MSSFILPTEPAIERDLPPWIWPRAAYLHIPFCAHHCGYCDFAVAVGQEQRIDAYLDALDREMSQLEKPQPVSTLFFGGGTPSLLSLTQTEQLFHIVDRWLTRAEGAEVSLEANPDDVTPEKVSLWSTWGINRVSLGAQSFRPEVLRVLERRHAAAEVPRAVETLKKAGQRVSLDLIFAVPGQTLANWRDDVARALQLEPDHLSTYGLTFEKGTRLWKQRSLGQVQSLTEEAELAMYLAGKEMLESAGFEHYEVSNFARPGRRSRHNQVYWANHAYWGFGMGAASYVRGVRRLNARDLTTYMHRSLAGKPVHFQEEELGPRPRALETVATQLRRLEGIERKFFRIQTGLSLEELIGDALEKLMEMGLLQESQGRVYLTSQGLCVADGVIQEIFKNQ